MLSLIIDSSTDRSAAVLAEDSRLISDEKIVGRPLSTLHVAISNVLRSHSISLSDLDRIAVVTGPGSWTGLHVAVTTAKTIAQLTEAPLAHFSLLHALAESTDLDQHRILVVSHAKHDQFYNAVFVRHGAITLHCGALKKSTLDQIIKDTEDAPPETIVLGNGAQTCFESLQHSSTLQSEIKIAYPTSAAFIRLALAAETPVLTGDAVFGLQPLYMQNEGEGPKPFANKK